MRQAGMTHGEEREVAVSNLFIERTKEGFPVLRFCDARASFGEKLQPGDGGKLPGEVKCDFKLPENVARMLDEKGRVDFDADLVLCTNGTVTVRAKNGGSTTKLTEPARPNLP